MMNLLDSSYVDIFYSKVIRQKYKHKSLFNLLPNVAIIPINETKFIRPFLNDVNNVMDPTAYHFTEHYHQFLYYNYFINFYNKTVNFTLDNQINGNNNNNINNTKADLFFLPALYNDSKTTEVVHNKNWLVSLDEHIMKIFQDACADSNNKQTLPSLDLTFWPVSHPWGTVPWRNEMNTCRNLNDIRLLRVDPEYNTNGNIKIN